MAEIEKITKNKNVSKKEIVDFLVYSTLTLSFITFNIVMAYSLINRFQSNSEAVLPLLIVAGALLAFGRLFYCEKRDRRSGRLEREGVRNKKYVVYYRMVTLFFGGLYALFLLPIGVGTIVDLAEHGLNDNNKILLAGVVGIVACSLLMALYSCVLEPLLSRNAESSKNSETIESVAVSDIEDSPRIAEQSL